MVTKTSVIRTALRDLSIIGRFRVDEASGLGSVMDTVRTVLGCNASTANAADTRLFAADDCMISLKSRTKYIRINGRGNISPVTDLKTMVEMIWKLPGKSSARFRRKSAETVCRVMGGDPALLQEIEQNNLMWRSVEGGAAIQQALLKPVEYKTEGESNRVKESSVRDALAERVD